MSGLGAMDEWLGFGQEEISEWAVKRAQ